MVRFNDKDIAFIYSYNDNISPQHYTETIANLMHLSRPTDYMIGMHSDIPVTHCNNMSIINAKSPTMGCASELIRKINRLRNISGIVLLIPELDDNIVNEFLLSAKKIYHIPSICVLYDSLSRIYRIMMHSLDTIVTPIENLHLELNREVRVNHGPGIPLYLPNAGQINITRGMPMQGSGSTLFAQSVVNILNGYKPRHDDEELSQYDVIRDIPCLRQFIRDARSDIYTRIEHGLHKYVILPEYDIECVHIEHMNYIMTRYLYIHGIYGNPPPREEGDYICSICFESTFGVIAVDKNINKMFCKFSPESSLRDISGLSIIQPHIVCTDCLTNSRSHPYTRKNVHIISVDDIDRAVDAFGHYIYNIYKPYSSAILYYIIRDTIEKNNWAREGDMGIMLAKTLQRIRYTDYCYISKPIEYYGPSLYYYTRFSKDQLDIILDDHRKYDVIKPADNYNYLHDFIIISRILNTLHHYRKEEITYEFIRRESPLSVELCNDDVSADMLRITLERYLRGESFPIPLYDEIY